METRNVSSDGSRSFFVLISYYSVIQNSSQYGDSVASNSHRAFFGVNQVMVSQWERAVVHR